MLKILYLHVYEKNRKENINQKIKEKGGGGRDLSVLITIPKPNKYIHGNISRTFVMNSFTNQ